MAWPANIAPQTPSVQYDGVTLCLAPAVPPDIFVLIHGNTINTIKGARSRCRIDLPLYDQTTTRDEVWASQIGRAPMDIIVDTSSGAGGLTVFTNNGDSFTSVASGDTATNVLTDDTITTLMKQSDPFTHIPPHQNIVGTTMMRWYDGPLVMNLPTGNMVGEVDAALYIESGSAIQQSLT